MGETFGVLQMPMLFAAEDFGDAAGEVGLEVADQRAGDGAHAGSADPAGLFIRRGAELAAVRVVELWRPFGDPALGLPALDFGDETTVTGGKVLGSQVQAAGIAAFARHAPAAAAAFVEKVDGMPGIS